MADVPVDELKAESIPQLLRELSDQTTMLLRQEIDLAKVELAEKAKSVGKSAGFFGAGAAFGVGTFGALTVVFISLLALLLPVWAAALIVTIIYAIATLIALQLGRKQLSNALPVVPQQTAQTVKEDVEWLKTRVQSSRK